MFKKYLYLLATAVLIGFTGCEALDDLDKYPDPKIETSITYPINGEYFVTLDMLDGTEWVEDVYGYGFVKVMLSNTAANDPDIVWFDDFEFWPTKAKIKCDPANKSFVPGTFNANYDTQIIAKEDTTDSGDLVLEVFKEDHSIEYTEVSVDKSADAKDSVLVSGYAITVNVISGSIELGTYEAASKTKTDKFTIQLEWSDDPGTIYRYNGYRRTGFLEDEH